MSDRPKRTLALSQRLADPNNAAEPELPSHRNPDGTPAAGSLLTTTATSVSELTALSLRAPVLAVAQETDSTRGEFLTTLDVIAHPALHPTQTFSD